MAAIIGRKAEMDALAKYNNSDKFEYNKVLKRKEAFDTAVDGKATRLVLFTTKGIKKNSYSDVFQATITLNDLYKF